MDKPTPIKVSGFPYRVLVFWVVIGLIAIGIWQGTLPGPSAAPTVSPTYYGATYSPTKIPTRSPLEPGETHSPSTVPTRHPTANAETLFCIVDNYRVEDGLGGVGGEFSSESSDREESVYTCRTTCRSKPTTCTGFTIALEGGMYKCHVFLTTTDVITHPNSTILFIAKPLSEGGSDTDSLAFGQCASNPVIGDETWISWPVIEYTEAIPSLAGNMCGCSSSSPTTLPTLSPSEFTTNAPTKSPSTSAPTEDGETLVPTTVPTSSSPTASPTAKYCHTDGYGVEDNNLGGSAGTYFSQSNDQSAQYNSCLTECDAHPDYCIGFMIEFDAGIFTCRILATDSDYNTPNDFISVIIADNARDLFDSFIGCTSVFEGGFSTYIRTDLLDHANPCSCSP